MTAGLLGFGPSLFSDYFAAAGADVPFSRALRNGRPMRRRRRRLFHIFATILSRRRRPVELQSRQKNPSLKNACRLGGARVGRVLDETDLTQTTRRPGGPD